MRQNGLTIWSKSIVIRFAVMYNKQKYKTIAHDIYVGSELFDNRDLFILV